MLVGRSMNEIAVELKRQLKSKRDFIVPTSFLSMTVKANLCRKNNGLESIPLTNHAHHQLSNYCDIPRAYYDRMREADKSLLQVNVNSWLQRKPADDKRMVRTLDGSCRAFLSDRYLPIDNWDVLNILLPSITKAGCEIVSAEVTENKMYVKAVTPRITGEIKVGEVAQAGLELENSEIGQGRVIISPLIYILRCKNGLIVNDMSLKRIHVGRRVNEEDLEVNGIYSRETIATDIKSFLLKARDSVNAILDQAIFNRVIKVARAAAGMPIASPSGIIEEVTDKYGLNDTESDCLMKHLISGGDLSQWGLVNAMTEMAHADVTDYDRSTKLERIGGEILFSKVA